MGEHKKAASLEEKIAGLRCSLSRMESALVCFSGGVDSAYVLAEAVGAMGPNALALTAVSPSLAEEEGAAARRLAADLGAGHVLVETHELDDPRYAANPANRCYFCKTGMYGRAVAEARARGIAFVLDGFNADDRHDYRPGQRAARELGVRSPLDELDFTKADIREAARRRNLPVWNKPALACLASRFPQGVEITPERLRQVAQCEQVLRRLGFRVVRVRYHEVVGDVKEAKGRTALLPATGRDRAPVARIEVSREEIARFDDPSVREEVVREFRAAGFASVNVDMEGYRTGSLARPRPAQLVSLG